MIELARELDPERRDAQIGALQIAPATGEAPASFKEARPTAAGPQHSPDVCSSRAPWDRA